MQIDEPIKYMLLGAMTAALVKIAMQLDTIIKLLSGG
jgi:hypothetical protein